MSFPSGSNPRDPTTVLQTCQRTVSHFVNEQLPDLLSAMSTLPLKTWERYAERHRSFDTRQGPIGDPFKGFIDPGLVDGIDERRRRYEEYLEKRRRERQRDDEKKEESDDR